MAKCRCPSSYTAPAYIWAFLSIISAILCPIGIYFSNWLVRDVNGTINSVSSFRVCLNQTTEASLSCSSYLTFDQIFSAEWKAVTLLMGAGGCFLMLVALTSIFGFCVRRLYNMAVMILTLIFQALGTILFIISLILFPAGMSAPEVRNPALCGMSADRFSIGDCSVGWAYIVTIVGTFFALVATSMSWTTYRWRDRDDDDDRDSYNMNT